MAKAPTNGHARARAAYVLGRITASQYAECVHGRAFVTSGFFCRRFNLFRRDGRERVELHRLPPIGTHSKEARNG